MTVICSMEKVKKYIEQNTCDLNVVILHFRVNRNLLFICFDNFSQYPYFVYRTKHG